LRREIDDREIIRNYDTWGAIMRTNIWRKYLERHARVDADFTIRERGRGALLSVKHKLTGKRGSLNEP